MISYTCRSCGAAMSSPDSLVGHLETCPDCGTVTTVPKPDGKRPHSLGLALTVLAVIFVSASMISLSYSCSLAPPGPSTLSTPCKSYEEMQAEAKPYWSKVEREQALHNWWQRHAGKMRLLEYTVVSKQNISYAGCPRMVYRVVLNVTALPRKGEVWKVAYDLWSGYNERWEEFTVFVYLPGMDTNSLAYAVVEFGPFGLKELRVLLNAKDVQLLTRSTAIQ